MMAALYSGVRGLHAVVLDVEVDSGFGVVEEVPAGVVGVFVDDEVIAAVPAPVGEGDPVPVRNCEVAAAAEPEAVGTGVDAGDAEAVIGADFGEVASGEGVVEVEAGVVGGGVAVPLVMIDVLGVIDVAGDLALCIGTLVGLRAGARSWGRRRMSLVGAGGR